jgi:hypothetical protein
MELSFWKKVGIDPYYMYIDDTINIVDQSIVEHNRELMDKEIKSVKVEEDEYYEFDAEGDLMVHMFD